MTNTRPARPVFSSRLRQPPHFARVAATLLYVSGLASNAILPHNCAAHAGLLLPHGGGTPALPPSSDGNSSEAVAAQSVAHKVNPRPATGGPAQTANDGCRETRAPLRLCP